MERRVQPAQQVPPALREPAAPLVTLAQRDQVERRELSGQQAPLGQQVRLAPSDLPVQPVPSGQLVIRVRPDLPDPQVPSARQARPEWLVPRVRPEILVPPGPPESLVLWGRLVLRDPPDPPARLAPRAPLDLLHRGLAISCLRLPTEQRARLLYAPWLQRTLPRERPRRAWRQYQRERECPQLGALCLAPLSALRPAPTVIDQRQQERACI